MFDGFSTGRERKYFRLFVDGIDVDTGLEFTVFWRKKGKLLLIIGSVMIFVVVLVYILAFVLFQQFDIDLVHLASLTGICVLLGFGVAFIVIAFIIFKKYTKPRSYVQTSQSIRNV